MNIEAFERRKFSRINLDGKVNLYFKNNDYDHSRIKNLSISGMFIMGKFRQRNEESCYVELIQTGLSKELTLETFAKIIRKNDKGVGIEFISMTHDNYMNLQTTLLYAVNDPFSIVHEFPDNSPFPIMD